MAPKLPPAAQEYLAQTKEMLGELSKRLKEKVRLYSERVEETVQRMTVHHENMDFFGDLEAATVLQPRLSASLLLGVVALSMFVLLIWASLAKIERVASGSGRIIPSSQVQMVQSLEGGIISEILVREGQQVSRQQTLLAIDNTQAMSKYNEDRSKHLSFMAAMARLESELNDQPEIQFPEEVLKEAPQLAASEMTTKRTRAESLASSTGIFQSQIDQKEQEVLELDARVSQLERSYKLAVDEAKILEPLVQKGVASKLELIQLQRQINDAQGALSGARQGLLRAKSGVDEARQRLEEKRNAFRSEAQAQYNEIRLNYSALSEAIKSTHDRLVRTDLKSPVDGTIKQIFVTSVGGVIKPGEDVIAIVPSDDSLLVEAKIRPSDIAFLHPGQIANIRVTAYDSSVFGSLKAKLEHISADSILDEKGESYFKVDLRTQGSLVKDGVALPMIPGMTAEVDIVTGQRTILEYLLKPVFMAKERAMRER